ncbi:glutamate-cysteine ligase modifier subunit [Xylariaceae sp. FL0255]|nr:glutamate-cysteine ligase modifier subunit [Xylariaceae sp. FL0255]
MPRIVLSTGNIVSAGPSIIRKPGTYRSNLELINSLRSNFTGAQEDYGATTNGDQSHASNGVNGHAVNSWTETDDSVLYIPRVDWSAAGLQEDRAQYEITVKLFFLPTASPAKRAEHIQEALRLVAKELRIEGVDLLIASFPGISFEGDCEWEADKINATMGNDDEEVATWAVLEDLFQQGKISKLGIAEFGSAKLQRFIDKVTVRPAVDQINIRNCCNVPPPLTKLAKAEGIELLTHGDSIDILPSGTIRELLGSQGAGVLADDANIIPEWVVKYTAYIKNRGVIENKGYFAGADLV